MFGKNTANDLLKLNERALLDIMDGVPTVELNRNLVDGGLNIVSFLADYKIYNSKGEAKKGVQANAVSINKIKVNDMDFNIEVKMLLADKYILVQKGKKEYYLVNVK